MHSATVIGESLVDVVQTRSRPTVERPGGSPLNVAVTLARLGIATELVTALGDDARADTVERHLARSGVTLAPGARCLPATSSAIAQVGPDGSAEYRLDIRWELPSRAVDARDLVHAGSIALFLEPGSDVVQDILRRSAQTALVSLDPNIRPRLLPPPEVVRKRFEALVSCAHVVKLSDEDAAWLYPDLSHLDVLDHLLATGPALVAISRGSQGAVLSSGRSTVEVRAPQIDVADTIGAGDAFMGGLLTQLLELGLASTILDGVPPTDQDLAEIGSFAAKVAALTVSRLGADPPRREELAAYDAADSARLIGYRPAVRDQ